MPLPNPHPALRSNLHSAPNACQVFRALEKWARVRPSDRHHACAACQAEAAASRQASAAAAKAAGEGSSTEGSKGGDGGAAGESGTEPAAAAAGGATGSGPVQLGGGTERCSSCSSSGGYTSLESVLHVPPHRRDKASMLCVLCAAALWFGVVAWGPGGLRHMTNRFTACRSTSEVIAPRAGPGQCMTCCA